MKSRKILPVWVFVLLAGLLVMVVEALNQANTDFVVLGREIDFPEEATEEGAESSASVSPTPTIPFIIHVVQPGDTTYSIAVQYGVTILEIAEANNMENYRVVGVGQSLIIPGIEGTATPTREFVAAAPSSGTPAPAGANLFPNPSFEGDIYDHNGIQELQVPQGWFIYVDEGPNTLDPGSGGNFFRPESRVFADANLPAHEIPLFLWDGTHGIKVFKGGAPTHFGLFTDVYLQPGTYRATFRFFADAVLAYDGGTKIWATDPLSAEYRIIHGTGGTAWTPATIGQKNTITYTITVARTGAVRLGVGFRNRFIESNNGWMIDDWSLVKVN